jgi:hypothetical protein
MGNLNTILQSDNIHRVAMATYEQKTQERVANNKLTAKKLTLAEFSRSLANNTRMRNAGKEFNAATTQLSHELEQAGKDKLSVQLQHGEAQGALQAQAAMAGVGGASVELMDNLIDLQRVSQEEDQRRAIEIMSRHGRVATAGIVANAADSTDLRQSFGQFDFSKDIKPKPLQHKWATVVGVAVATYFGGPQAGEAAADAAVGEWKARNGDFVGAGQSFGGALSGAMDAMKDYSDRGGGSWFDSLKQNTAGDRALSNNSAKTGANVKSVNKSKGFFKWGG